jgi:GH15 family glucan-1,4-alpha-glucosidase
MDTLHVALKSGIGVDEDAWRLQAELLAFIEESWDEPDEGIWEVRGARRHFTHSKVMTWVAVDRAIRNAELAGWHAPLDRWRALRERIRESIYARGFSSRINSFVQSYGDETVDASLLRIPLVGFLPPDDPRVVGTVQAVERELLMDGFVRRYDPDGFDDGIGGGEGAFMACSFWLADVWLLMGRRREARELFERLLAVRNDLGLLAEEYDPRDRRQLGNFPQAFSHIALINTAFNLARQEG